MTWCREIWQDNNLKYRNTCTPSLLWPHSLAQICSNFRYCILNRTCIQSKSMWQPFYYHFLFWFLSFCPYCQVLRTKTREHKFPTAAFHPFKLQIMGNNHICTVKTLIKWFHNITDPSFYCYEVFGMTEAYNFHGLMQKKALDERWSGICLMSTNMQINCQEQ